MDQTTIHLLKKRNKRIINLVLKKIELLCPGSVDLIGIAGSFESGDFHEKSDLDLVIIANNESANILNKCFILNGIGFDIYCSKWNRFETMAQYSNPHVSKLLHLDIVYSKDKESKERYLDLRQELLKNISNKEANEVKAYNFYNQALKEFGQFILCEDADSRLQHLFTISTNIENFLFLLNSSYLRRGIKRVIEELGNLKELPDEFIENYKKIFVYQNLIDLKDNVTALMKSLKAFVSKRETKKNKEESLKQLTAEDLQGLYEEAFSNWKGKIEEAKEKNDFYSQFMAIASCNEFYNDIQNKFEIKLIKILDKYNPNDLVKNIEIFESGLGELSEIYSKYGQKTARYSSLEEFEKNYLTY